MRILYCRTQYWFNLPAGGSVAHTAGVLRAFAEQANVEVIGNGVPPGAEGIPCLVVPPVLPRLDWLGELAYNVRFAKPFRARLGDFKPDFVYHRHSGFSFQTARSCHLLNVPLVLEFNGSDRWMLRNWTTRRLKHRLAAIPMRFILHWTEPHNLRHATLITVVSRPLRDGLIAEGVEERRILVNPNGVDPERYSPSVDGAGVRERLGLTGTTVVGFIGTFGKWHGAEVLAEAFAQLVQANPHCRETVRLLMIGDGVTLPQVRDIVRCHGLADICVFTGTVPQEQGPEYLAACDVLVSPQVPNADGTPFFGSPTKLFEYMAMGKGIVASDLDQIGEVIEHGRTGWLVKPGDPEALAAGLRTLVDAPELRSRLGAAARQRVLERHTWREHTRSIIEKLKELCPHARRGASPASP